MQATGYQISCLDPSACHALWPRAVPGHSALPAGVAFAQGSRWRVPPKPSGARGFTRVPPDGSQARVAGFHLWFFFSFVKKET